MPSQNEVINVISNTHARHRAQLVDQLNSVRSLYLSQELRPTADSQMKLATFSIHYIENWSFKHQMVSCIHIANSELPGYDWQASQKSSLADVAAEADVVATLYGLTEVNHLPGFSTRVTSTVEDADIHSEHLGQKGYGSLLDRAVVNALRKSDQKLIEVINKAASMLNVPDFDWHCDVSNCKSLPWFEQLRLLDMVLSRESAMREQEADACGSGRSPLDADDFILLSKIIEVLRPFQEVAERVRNPNSVTCSLAFASIMLLKAALKDLDEAYPDFQLVAELRTEFQSVTSSIDNGQSNTYTTATILDPRFKLQWCDSENQSKFKKSFIEAAKDNNAPKPEVCKSEYKPSSTQCGGFFTRILKQQPESLQVGTITSEVLRYLDEPLMQEDCDVLNYWQGNETNFPHLSLLAQRYLAMPTSASNIDHVFELKGQILDVKHTPLSGDILEKIIELRPGFQQ